jgi:Flp pilus assembly protein TadD
MLPYQEIFMQYYIGFGNERRGPFELDQLLAHGVQPETLVWHQGLTNWVRAVEVAEIKELLISTRPPVPSDTGSRRKASRPLWRSPVVLGAVVLLFIALADWMIVNVNNWADVKRWEDIERIKAPDRAFKHGRIAEMKGDFDEAITDYTDAIRLKADFSEAYNNRGLAYSNKGEFEKAIADLNEAIRLKPNDAVAYCNRAFAYDNKGEHDKAIADYTEAIRLKPDYIGAYNNRGSAYSNKGDFDKAITDLNEAVRLKPDCAEAYNGRGVAFASRGEFDKAIADCTVAIRLKPDYTMAYNNRGICYMKKGDSVKAANDLNRAKELGFKPPQ